LEQLRLDYAAVINELNSAIDFKAVTLASIGQVPHGFMQTAKNNADLLEDAVDRKKTTECTSTI